MNKKQRHNEIVKAVEIGGITSQSELHSKLNTKGITVTQATLSRDINEIGIIKEKGIYKTPNIEKCPLQLGSLHSITPIGDCFLMIHTSSGLANAVAEFIDLSKPKGVVGTVAGDNTILIGLAKNTNQNQVIKFISLAFDKSTRARRSR